MNSNLEQLVREMNPLLHDGEWVFCELAQGAAVPRQAIATFRESESMTVIVSAADATALSMTPRYNAAWITLTVNSDLDAVGFLAVISRALAAANISCNVFSAVHHDHLFVPYREGHRAVEVLRRLQMSPFDPQPIQ